MADKNWLVQSCCNPSITAVIAPNPMIYEGAIFQDSLKNCYTVIQIVEQTPTIVINEDDLPLYKDCLSCISNNPCPPPYEDTKTWLVQSCCDKGITQIVVNNNIVPGDVFQDSLGDCYTVLTITKGNPTIVIIDETVYKTCEDCKPCVSTSPTPTPSITQSPFPTPSITPSVTVTPSPSPVTFVNSSPSPTPTVTVSRTPSVTPSINTPVCKCITYINTSISSSYQGFYTDCSGFVGAQFTITPQQTIQVCGSNPSAGNPAVTFYTGSYCQNEECVTPDISPSPTPTPSPTSVSGSLPEPEPLCMGIVFGPAPSPSATPSKTVSVTPSITVSPSSYPIFPSLSPAATPSVTPSVTPSKTPSISVSTTPSTTPSVTPTKTVTPSVTPSKTPSITVSPTKTPTPTPTQSGGALVVPECSVIYNNNDLVYSYNNTTNVSTLLNLGISPLQGISYDIAHTINKLWLYEIVNGYQVIYEYNITLSPFTSTYNRSINLPIGVALGGGMCAINDTTLLSSNAFTNVITKITLNNDNIGQTQPATTTLENLFTLPSGRSVAGDLLYTTNNKIIITTQTWNSPYYYYISQYTLNASGVWTLEFEQNITNTAPLPYGLATINGGIYIFSGNNLKQISTTFPYTVTQVNNIGNSLAGASQVPSCNNVSFQPNIIGASPSPTPTPTKTVTPSITISPSVTPSKTPSKTPTPSPTSNTTPCQGNLPMPSGSTTINGVTIIASGTGNINLYPNPYASCGTTTPGSTPWLGQSAAFTYTLTFSQPVNNIKLPITGLAGQTTGEIFTFTTNGGTPTITSPNNCLSTITGNQIKGNSPLVGNGGGGLFTFSAPSPFTTLTITGPGGTYGAIVGIDCNSILPAPPADCVSCNIQALPTLGTGSITNGNLTVSTTYNGPTIPTFSPPPSTFMTCVGTASPGPGGTVALGNQPGPFTYVLNFNQPVNNIKFLIDGGGTAGSTLYESFTFNTNGGVPTLSACGTSCGTIINNNTLQLTLVLPYGGGILTQVKATNPYTQIIITGNGGLQGSTFSLCLDTATPLPSPSPSVTPTVTKSPSKTPSVTATPSISVSKTPSVTPSKTATPSITISPSRTPSVTPSSSPPSAVCPLIYTSGFQSYNGNSFTNGIYNKNYTWNPNTNVQQEIVLPNDVQGAIAATDTKLWKSFFISTQNTTTQYINEWNLSGNPPYTATFSRTLSRTTQYQSPGLTAKNNNTLVDITFTNINGQIIYKVYEINIPASPGTQLTSTFKFNLNSNFLGHGDLMLTSDINGNPDKLLVAGNISNPTPGTTEPVTGVQQYDYNTGAFEFETILTPLPSAQYIAGIAQFNNIIYTFFVGNQAVYTINSNPPYNWTLVNNTIRGGDATSILSCSKGKLVGPNTSGCNNILYRTQTSQYYSYNFTTNTSALLNVAPNPYPTNDINNPTPITLANTATKSWVYAWNSSNTNFYSDFNVLRESDITLNPFTSTFNRTIALPQILGNRIKPGKGLFAISNTKLIGTIEWLTGYGLFAYYSEAEVAADPVKQYANGVMIVEYDITSTSNVATWVQKAKLFPNEVAQGGLLLTSTNKLIILSKHVNGNDPIWINQYDYNTGVLEFRKELSPTITGDCSLAEVNGNIYIMGFNIYKIDTVAPYNLTLVQNTGNQLVASSQLASCIPTNFPTSSCNGTSCIALPLKLVTPVTYNGITIVPTYTGPTATDNTYPPAYTSCEGDNLTYQPRYSAFLGHIPGNYTYTLTFSQPVNNIKIQYNGTTADATPYELFTWNTNGGVPNLSLCKSCFQTIDRNIISGSGSAGNRIQGGGIVTITAPSSYTILTLTSPGGNQGSVFSICSSSIVPAPNPSPSPTPSSSPPCTPCSRPDVIIGTQIWKGCNLDVTTYRDGTSIPQVQNRSQWANLTTGAWCYYDASPTNGCVYGKIYNWYAVNDPRGLAPNGYHVPTEAEVVTLQSYLGGYLVAGGKLKTTGTLQAGTGLWLSPNEGATNETGWNGVPGGGFNGNDGSTGKGYDGVYWTSTLSSIANNAKYFDTYFQFAYLDVKSWFKTEGKSVRLIRDNTPSLGCVYYNKMGYLYNYNILTNTSFGPITLPNIGADSNTQNDTHTLTKYWKSNNTNLIQEWIPTNNPTTLAFNRNISINTGYAAIFYSFAINDTTLLAIGSNTPSGASTNNVEAMLIRIDITNNTITPAQVTPLFQVGFPNTSLSFGSMLLTTTNKLLYVGTRFNSNNTAVITYLRQFSYPDGALELEYNLAPFVPDSNTYGNYVNLFESNGNIFFTHNGQPTLTPTNIYQINLNSPYTITLVGTLPETTLRWNSSLNCNTVNLNVSPNPSPTPTPSPSAPSSAFRTIYKYLDIQ